MSMTQTLKALVQKSLVGFGIIVMGLVIGSTCVAPAYACDLPDGSTNGYYLSDGRTCCPPTTSDAESCIYGKYVNPAIDLLAALVGVVVTIAIIYGAIEYITSGGDPKRAASAKQHITNALIGLVGFILLYAVLQFLIPGGKLNG